LTDLHFGFNLIGGMEYVAESAQVLEDLGYDFIGIGEHLMLGPTQPTALSIPALGVAAGATRRIRLLSSVVLLPLYNPILLAKMVSTLDVASKGRYTLGVGLGGEFPAEFRAVGVPIEHRGRRADEALLLLKQLWTQSAVSFHGRYYRCEGVTLNPPPKQLPHPPIWIGGRSEAAMVRAARLGDGWLPYMYNLERYRKSIYKIRELAADTGRDLSRFSWGFHQHIVLAENVREAFRNAVKVFRYKGGRNIEEIIQDYWAYGAPNDIVKKIEPLIELGVTEFSLLTPYADARIAMEQAQTFAKRVMPYFRGSREVDR